MSPFKSLLASTLLLASPALAQDISIQAGPHGLSMQANIPDDGAMGASAQTLESSSEGYRLAYETNAGGATVMKVLAPEGAQCQVWDGRRLVAEDGLPMSFDARPDRFYRIRVKLADGQVWEKKLSAKRGQIASLWVTALAPAPAPQVQTQVVVHEVHHVHHEQPAPPPPPMPVAMYEADFAALKNAIAAEAFSAQKHQVLDTAVGSALFTVAQVGQIVDLFDFGNDKVKAVETISAGRIVDRQNAYQLYSHFDFSSEKEKVKRLLAQ
jgi:hypothetical protein